ncbi:MAG: Ig-like domain-containing protein [Steroidobacteraceae bacterium]
MIRSHKLQYALLMVALATSIGTWRDADAFSLENHALITREALVGTGSALQAPVFPLRVGDGLAFSEAAAMEVVQGNGLVDVMTLAGTIKGTEPRHFDDNMLLEGTTFIDKKLVELRDVVMRVPKGITARDGALLVDAGPTMQMARYLFGQVLHTVQDFYAHSTWVERGGRPGGVPWGDVLFRAKPTFDAAYKSTAYLKFDGDGNQSSPCINGVASSLTAAAKVASEFFQADIQKSANGSCVHGPSARRTCQDVLSLPQTEERLDKLLCQSFYSVALDTIGMDGGALNGLNKDKDGRPGYPDARRAAAAATFQLATDVMRTIGDYDVNVLRLFLGRDLPDLPEAFDGTFSVLQSNPATLKPLSAGAKSLEIVTQPQHGTVTVNTDGTFTYQPTGAYFGADQFTFRGRNAAGTSSIGTASLTIGRSFAGMWLITIRPAGSIGCPLEAGSSFFAEVARVSVTQYQSLYRGAILDLTMPASDSPAGPAGNLSVTYNDGAGRTTENITAQMPDSTSLTGTSNWSYQGPDGTCSGRTDFSGVHKIFY